LEQREKELNFQVKLKELEAKVNRSTIGVAETGAVIPFDVSKHFKFVPDYHETEVDKYFLRRLPKTLNGPRIIGHYYYKAPWWVRQEKCIQPCQLMIAPNMKLSRMPF